MDIPTKVSDGQKNIIGTSMKWIEPHPSQDRIYYTMYRILNIKIMTKGWGHGNDTRSNVGPMCLHDHKFRIMKNIN